MLNLQPIEPFCSYGCDSVIKITAYCLLLKQTIELTIYVFKLGADHNRDKIYNCEKSKAMILVAKGQRKPTILNSLG